MTIYSHLEKVTNSKVTVFEIVTIFDSGNIGVESIESDYL